MRAAVLAILFLAACSAHEQSSAEPLTAADGGGGVCVECACKAVECGPDAGPPPCETCRPEPDGGAGGCATGCCGLMHDSTGAIVVDETGAPRYGCVETACRSDSECRAGLTCVAGDTCDQNRCLCPDGEPPWDEDPEYPCCRVRDGNGVCCTSGLVDTDSLECMCADPLMSDRGDGCACPPDMEPDEVTGVCTCLASGAERDVDGCACPLGTWMHFDEYVGRAWCAGDDDPPPECGDEHAVFDPVTGTCTCADGFVLRTVDDYVTPSCAPPLPPDAGVEPVPDAPLAPDAGVHDAPLGPTPLDAGVVLIREDAFRTVTLPTF